jgi:hypothetical protein
MLHVHLFLNPFVLFFFFFNTALDRSLGELWIHKQQDMLLSI